MEHFAWLSSLELDRPSLLMVSGPGFTTMKPSDGAYASVMDIARGDARGHLLSSTAVLRLRAADEVRYVVLKRDEHALVAPNQWQFPAGRCSPGEAPLTTACRELSEEVRIEGEHTSWDKVAIRVGGGPVEYLTDDAIMRFRGRMVFMHNTVEFWYPMELAVSAFDAVQLSDNEPYSRGVALLTLDELNDLAGKGLMTEPAAAMLRAEQARLAELS